jgi:RIO kinase 1
MNIHTTEYLDELDELDDRDDLRPPRHRRKGKRVKRNIKLTDVTPGDPVRPDPAAEFGSETPFDPTFSSSRFERAWILEYLGPLYREHYIADVLRLVKGGKEATVYCCSAHTHVGVPLLAAKVYRPQEFRALKNDAQYRKGREVLDVQGNEVRGRREALAMKKKTRFGQELRHTSWLSNEYQHLQALHEANVAVPKPIVQSDNAILMEYFGSEEVPAPALHSVRLTTDEARSLFDRIVHNIALMLEHGCVHADLSAFNILYWQGDIRIIDLPQAVDPYKNPNAFKLFERDVTRVCQYFERYDIGINAVRLTRDLWARHIQRDTTEVFLR